MEGSVKNHYDFICIGAGSGAMGAGRRAATFGKKVAMIENKVIGGTCVNVGCVPKKVMFNLANFLEEAQVMKDYGVIGADQLKLDFSFFKKQRDAYIKRLNAIYMNNINGQNIDYIHGTASFVTSKILEVTNGDVKERYSADHIVIASGSSPQEQTFVGKEHCWNSDQVFQIEELPKTIIVIGAGYIGIEMAQIFQALGTQTTIVARDIALRFVDQDVVEQLRESMKKLGLDLRCQTPFSHVTKEEDGLLTLHLEDGTKLRSEKILVAIGRPPNLEGLNLESIGVELNRGAVKVDADQNTTCEGVYAIGDVTNQMNLTPVAIKAGRILSERLFNGSDLKMNYENIATVVFSHPPIGAVGPNEIDAKAKYGEDKIKIYKSKFTNMFYSLALDDKHKLPTIFKLICLIQDNGDEKVIGFHGLGRGIDEMMQLASVVVNMGGTKRDFDSSLAIHPTASEELVLMDAKLY